MKKSPIIKTNSLIIETAMVVYQVLEDTRLHANVTLPDNHPLKQRELTMPEWCDNFGSATIRDQSWQIAPKIEECWRGMTEDERDGAITWDWEFVPEFLLYCVDFDPNDEDLSFVSDDTEELIKKWREGRATCVAFKSELPPSTHERDVFFQECREEAEKQWKYADLISDHPDLVQRAFEAKEKPAEFVKALGEDLELIDFGPWK